jgi:outer membrane protein
MSEITVALDTDSLAVRSDVPWTGRAALATSLVAFRFVQDQTMRRLKAIVAATLVTFIITATQFAQEFVGGPTVAPVKVAFVDLRRIAAESAEGKTVTEKIQALTQQKSTELEARTKALVSAQQEIEKNDQTLTDAERAKLLNEINRLNVEIKRFKQDANSEIQAMQQQLFQPLQDKVRPILDAMTKELGIQVLFSRADVAAFLVDTKLDITEEVIKRLDSASAKPPESPKR